MDEFQAGHGGTVVSFARHGAAAAAVAFASCFTPRDRMDISDWRDAAKIAGYDRMVIHDRDYGDAQEVGNFLSLYRHGESWSRWGFARRGRTITGWCCLTSMDMGQFDTVANALRAVIGAVTDQVGTMMVSSGRHSAEVTELAARRRAWAGRLGSAA